MRVAVLFCAIAALPAAPLTKSTAVPICRTPDHLVRSHTDKFNISIETVTRWGPRANAGRTPGIDEPQALRLKRVFNIDIESCKTCGGRVKIIACIEGPGVIERILTHLERKQASTAAPCLPPCRAPPQARLFD